MVVVRDDEGNGTKPVLVMVVTAIVVVVIANIASVVHSRGGVGKIAKTAFASLGASFAATSVFSNAVRKTFQEIDEDGSGKIDAEELYIGVLLIFDRINSALPMHEHPPTRAEVKQMLSKFDVSRDGALDFDEFETLANGIMDPRKGGGAGRAILPALCGNLFLTAVVLPGCAYIVRTALASCLTAPYAVWINALPIACISPLVAAAGAWFIENSKQIAEKRRKVARE